MNNFQIPKNKQNKPKIGFSFIKFVSYWLPTSNFASDIGRYFTFTPGKHKLFLKENTSKYWTIVQIPKNKQNKPKIAFSFIKFVSYWLPTSNFASDIGRYFTFTPGKHKLLLKGKHIQILKNFEIPKYKQNKPKIAFSFIKFVSYWLPTSNFAWDIRRYFTSTPGKQILF